MNGELPGAPIFKEELQRGRDRAEREFVPRDLGFCEEANLETLVPGREVEIQKLGTKKNMHLLDVRYVEHREQRSETDARTSFFDRFALGTPGGNFPYRPAFDLLRPSNFGLRLSAQEFDVILDRLKLLNAEEATKVSVEMERTGF